MLVGVIQIVLFGCCQLCLLLLYEVLCGGVVDIIECLCKGLVGVVEYLLYLGLLVVVQWIGLVVGGVLYLFEVIFDIGEVVFEYIVYWYVWSGFYVECGCYGWKFGVYVVEWCGWLGGGLLQVVYLLFLGLLGYGLGLFDEIVCVIGYVCFWMFYLRYCSKWMW